VNCDVTQNCVLLYDSIIKMFTLVNKF